MNHVGRDSGKRIRVSKNRTGMEKIHESQVNRVVINRDGVVCERINVKVYRSSIKKKKIAWIYIYRNGVVSKRIENDKEWR